MTPNRAERSKLATVRSAAAAIAAACRAVGRPDPTKTPLVADTLRGIARQYARQSEGAPRQARVLTYDQARELECSPSRCRTWGPPRRRSRRRCTSGSRKRSRASTASSGSRRRASEGMGTMMIELYLGVDAPLVGSEVKSNIDRDHDVARSKRRSRSSAS